MFKNMWRYHPKYWDDWLWYFQSDLKFRFEQWWFWYSPPWSQWKRCGCCSGEGDEHHSFGGNVDVLECNCCRGMGVIKKH